MSQDIIKTFPSPVELAHAMAEDFILYADSCIRATGSCVVGVTGGSVADAFFLVLGKDEYRKRINWERLFVVWTDERFIPEDDPDNYFGRVKALVGEATYTILHMYPIHTDQGSVVNAAAAYEKELHAVLDANGKSSLDLAMLDLGDDGHICGLFPGSAALRDEEHDVVPVQDGKVWDRVTMTLPFLARSQAVWFGIVGNNKCSALAKVLHQREDYESDPWYDRIGHVLPGAVLSQESICWYVDLAAASKCMDKVVD